MSLFTPADRNHCWQVLFVTQIISGDGGHSSEEEAPDSSSVSRLEVKNSQNTALTSANPQLQAEVRAAALERACQQ